MKKKKHLQSQLQVVQRSLTPTFRITYGQMLSGLQRVVVESDGAVERLCQFIFHLAPDVVTQLSVTLKI